MNNNYYTKQTSRTIGSVAIAGILATHLLLPLEAKRKDLNLPEYKGRNVYQSSFILPTFDQVRSIITGEYIQGIDQFEAAISDFYATLVTRQQLLGIEFEEVLYKNLWNLYES